jgi:hypothetical protein
MSHSSLRFAGPGLAAVLLSALFPACASGPPRHLAPLPVPGPSSPPGTPPPLATLEATGSQPAEPPPPEPERSYDSVRCTIDTDCVLSPPVECCSNPCPTEVTPMSAAWRKWKMSQCAVVECARVESVACPPGPDRRPSVAVCVAGRCTAR